MFRNNDIPQEYNKLAEISDNYLVWVRESRLVSGTKYNAYIQYLSPSWLVVSTNDYMIKSGTNYRYNAHYSTNSMYNYLDYYDTSYELTTLAVSSDHFTSDIHSRADFPLIFVCGFLICLVFWWVFHNLSRLFFKGGL